MRKESANLKTRLAQQELLIGLWSNLCSDVVAEIVAGSAFDWALIDGEHSPNDLQRTLRQLQAFNGSGVTPVVRPAWNDPVLIKQLLDIGSRALLIPFVQNADEARAAVAATQYPPTGIRGVSASSRAAAYGRDKSYLSRANDEITVIVQLETLEALWRIDEIASVEGIDAIFVGPADLAASMGHIGQLGAAEVQDAIREAVGRINACGKPAGILSVSNEMTQVYINDGFTFVAVGSDVNLLTAGMDGLARQYESCRAG